MNKIMLENGNPDAWICRCGNMPGSDGFLACDREGVEAEPAGGWTGLYRCNRCGAIIDQATLNIVGEVESA